jgi:pimeloyl-ACP methyl ester carboxylesterase
MKQPLVLLLYEGCGHCPQVEAPERLTASLVAFAGSATLAR